MSELVFVLAITSGSCSGRHFMSFLVAVSEVTIDNVTVLGYWEVFLELVVEESCELVDNADMEACLLSVVLLEPKNI